VSVPPRALALVRANIARYVSLTDREFDEFASRLELRRLRKGEHLLRAGDVCHLEGFVNHGCLRVYALDGRGFEHIVYFAIEDWWVSDVGSFITQTPAELNIEATEDSEVLLIDNLHKEDLYVEVPKFERLFRIMTQRTHAALQQRLIAAMSQSAVQRYIDLTQRYPHIQKRVRQHQIASYLGVSPEFLCKIRKKLADKTTTAGADSAREIERS
jgi:CRP-like cAMP-binding protein